VSIRRLARHSAEPPGAVRILAQASLEDKAPFGIALEIGREALWCSDALNRQADKPVE